MDPLYFVEFFPIAFCLLSGPLSFDRLLIPGDQTK